MSANPGEEQCLVPGSLTASFSSRADEWWCRHYNTNTEGGYQRGRGLTNPQLTYRNTSTLTIDHPPPFLPDIVTIDINLSGFKLNSPLATQLDSSCAL